MKIYHDECHHKHEAVKAEREGYVRFACFGIVYEAENKNGWIEVNTSEPIYQIT